jgi:hypothetical protein
MITERIFSHPRHPRGPQGRSKTGVKWGLDKSVVDARHLPRKVLRVPTLSQGISTSQSEALMSSIVCRAPNQSASLAAAMHYFPEW